MQPPASCFGSSYQLLPLLNLIPSPLSWFALYGRSGAQQGLQSRTRLSLTSFRPSSANSSVQRRSTGRSEREQTSPSEIMPRARWVTDGAKVGLCQTFQLTRQMSNTLLCLYTDSGGVICLSSFTALMRLCYSLCWTHYSSHRQKHS